MTTLHTQDQLDLEDALRQAFAVRADPPATLQARLDAELARSRAAGIKRQLRRRTIRRGLTLAGAACALAFAVVMLPRVLVWRALAQMASSGESVRSMHRVSWIIEEDGSRRQTEETWFQDGRWRIERPREVTLHSGGRSYFYEPLARRATWRATQGPFAHNSSGFSVRAMIADMARWNWIDKVTLSPDVQVLEGRRARVVTIEPAREKIRIIIYADPGTLLPFRFDVQQPTRNGWKLSQTSVIEYNLPLQASLFETKFPPGTRVVREGEGREEWARSLQKPLAVLPWRKQRVVIRDASMYERGDVFVLVTAGRERDVDPGPGVMIDVESPDLALSGAEGELVLLTSLWGRPSTGSSLEADGRGATKRMDGVRVDGEPLRWAVWTRLEPLTPAQSARPQRLLLQARAVVYALRGNSFSDRVVLPESPKVTLNIRRATFGLLPSYVSFFAQRPTEADLEGATDEARAGALMYDENAGPEHLQKALALYRQIIARNEREWRASGNVGVQPDKWLSVAQMCLQLSRLNEAREALARAEEENRVYGRAADSTTRGIEKLKQQLERD